MMPLYLLLAETSTSEPSWAWMLAPGITLVGVFVMGIMLKVHNDWQAKQIADLIQTIKDLALKVDSHDTRLTKIETKCDMNHPD
jgi:hypothetical protein